jgi:copper(I)-binding protein
MNMLRRSAIFGIALLAAATVAARADSAVTVTDAWSPPALGLGPVYATITNTGDVPDRLIGAMTPNAASIELHDPTHGAKPVAVIVIPAHATVTLGASGPYLSLVGLKAATAVNDAFLCRIHFERAGWIVAIVRVRSS